MNDLMMVGATENSMTSLQIAEITGKQHSHVMRDIRNLLDKGLPKFNPMLTTYTTIQNKKLEMYVLDKDSVMIINCRYLSKELSLFCEQTLIVKDTRLEKSFSKLLLPVLKELGIICYTQYRIGQYAVDFCLDDYGLVIEYQDEYHKYDKQKKADAKREECISNDYGYSFLNLDSKDSNEKNLALVIKRIFK